MKFAWRTELPLLILIGALFVTAACAWSAAPDRIPVHWNIHGEVDRFGGKVEGLLGIPLVALALYLLLLFLPRLDPGYANYQRFVGAYTVVRYALACFLWVVYAVILLAAFGQPVSVTEVMMVSVGILFFVLGSVMGKIRPNWFCGIRTPWTLSSKASWNKTHRLGGWLFILIGLCMAAAGLIGKGWALLGTFIIAGVGLVGLIVYSYIIWRSDPDRVPPAGTTATNG
ncbi:MAG: SdpI family protein [Planctomycetaceae bacterium]